MDQYQCHHLHNDDGDAGDGDGDVSFHSQVDSLKGKRHNGVGFYRIGETVRDFCYLIEHRFSILPLSFGCLWKRLASLRIIWLMQTFRWIVCSGWLFAEGNIKQ